MLLARNWWVFLVRGIFALIFGLIAILMPSVAFFSLVLVFGIFALLDGIFTIAAAFFSDVRSEKWWWLVLEGIVGIVVGLFSIFEPAAMGNAWLFLIAIWAIATGVLRAVTAIRLRKLIDGEFWLILSGVFSLIFGILILASPASGAFAIGLIIGAYALIFGIALIGIAIRLKNHRSSLET
ncbi:MAG TPA: HdeD family acid-resistance protein [Pyrinomonadaceae bacterium]|nr:HdeD family acid-resistance protein [Pyrinomonadaceae bacterium]